MAAHSTLRGTLFVAGAEMSGDTRGFHAINPSTGAELEPEYAEASTAQIDVAARAAAEAFAEYRHTDGVTRARFLRHVADAIDDCTELPDRVHAESGIARERVLAERSRTTSQLRLPAIFRLRSRLPVVTPHRPWQPAAQWW